MTQTLETWLHGRAIHTHTHTHWRLLRQGFSSWGEAKASNLSLSCLSLALIKAYNELGTGTQSQDRWLYGPGQIITPCGLRLSQGENRKETVRWKKRWERNRGRKQRLKFYTPTFEKCFAMQPLCPQFTTRLFCQICAALLTLRRNKLSKFW